jgi:hypothetical protein
LDHTGATILLFLNFNPKQAPNRSCTAYNTFDWIIRVQRSQFQSRPIKNYHEQKQQQRHPLPHEAATNLAL